MGFALPQQGVIEGMWGGVGSVERVQARLLTANLGGPPPGRIDALWRGAIVARSVPANSRITAVATQRPDLEGIDDEIVAALGALPVNPVTLEQERRQRVTARIRATLDQPDAFTGDAFDRWLATVGAASTGDLLARFRTTAYSSALRVAFAPPDPLPPTPIRLPITAAVLVRDSATLAVGQLLADSKTLAERLQDAGLETPRDPALRPRHAVVVIWVVPATLFDDAHWPAAARAMPRPTAPPAAPPPVCGWPARASAWRPSPEKGEVSRKDAKNAKKRQRKLTAKNTKGTEQQGYRRYGSWIVHCVYAPFFFVISVFFAVNSLRSGQRRRRSVAPAVRIPPLRFLACSLRACSLHLCGLCVLCG